MTASFLDFEQSQKNANRNLSLHYSVEVLLVLNFQDLLYLSHAFSAFIAFSVTLRCVTNAQNFIFLVGRLPEIALTGVIELAFLVFDKKSS